LLLVALLVAVATISGCGSSGSGGAVYDAAHSPVLQTARIQTGNEGSEDSQYVRITLGFDREILVTDGYAPQLRIAGEAVDPADMTVAVTGDGLTELEVTVRVDKVQGGSLTLTLGKPGEDETGDIVAADTGTQRYAAGNDKTVEALLPTGVALAPAGEGVIEVTHAFNVRGIAWIVFTDGGETVEGSLLAGADTLDGAIALHGHAFLQDDEYDIAAALAETLTNHFGDRYTFTANGKTVEIRPLTGTATATAKDLRLSVYEYTLIV
jgi:hypothetical protein